MTTAASRETILADLTLAIEEVIGADEMSMMGPVTVDTTFQDDLEMESIEFVALAELLMERYGNRVDFTTWVAEMELHQILSLTVGNMVSLILEELGPTGVVPEPDG